ncbi:succinyldiaminopimelate aminotransferase [Salana multivorans]|uniref:Aminotransferase n=1 Tax=Salana multivorans TaxID=120377 RepID=A0A3N2D7P2_9MICO|nr:succinyldiaminopimelate transaminase [Salana multivorans]ROR95785.1 succinyldiaminopimelate aminotransferase [Salana multivorans]
MGFHELGVAYPWDAVVPLRERAGRHPGGPVDLSIGTPVDPTPALVQDALRAAADAHGYPTVAGPASLRRAVVDWYARERGVSGLRPEAVLPTIGSKELVALLPSQLGLGPGDVVVVPTMAYPTYEVGARLAGADVLASDDPSEWAGDPAVRLVWLNSPANPTGEVLPRELMAATVRAARAVGAVVASDECYAMLPWTEPWSLPRSAGGGVPCVLEDAVSSGDHTGLLSVYSLSKQSNLAGYRAAFVAGDADLVDRLLQQRRHLGMMPPAPVQRAMEVALGDREHVVEQVARYAARRELLAPALEAAGFVIDHSEAGLYLWVRPGAGLEELLAARGTGGDASRGPLCWPVMELLADLGIVAGPGIFYGPAAGDHVRVSLTASDADVAAAAERLSALAGPRASA